MIKMPKVENIGSKVKTGVAIGTLTLAMLGTAALATDHMGGQPVYSFTTEKNGRELTYEIMQKPSNNIMKLFGQEYSVYMQVSHGLYSKKYSLDSPEVEEIAKEHPQLESIIQRYQ